MIPATMKNGMVGRPIRRPNRANSPASSRAAPSTASSLSTLRDARHRRAGLPWGTTPSHALDAPLRPIVLISLVLFACGGEDEQAAAAPELAGTSWVLAGGIDVPGWEQVAPSAGFADGKLTGANGCNRYSTSYTLEGEALKLGDVATTNMACGEPGAAVETAFMDALGRVRRRGSPTASSCCSTARRRGPALPRGEPARDVGGDVVPAGRRRFLPGRGQPHHRDLRGGRQAVRVGGVQRLHRDVHARRGRAEDRRM